MERVEDWQVIFHDDFDSEFDVLSPDVQDELLATLLAVKKLGPKADRPHVGTLNNAKHPNMKELRFKANHGAVEKRFYKDLLKTANARFDSHLARFKVAQPEIKSKVTQGKKIGDDHGTKFR